jgi:hypothetical protein
MPPTGQLAGSQHSFELMQAFSHIAVVVRMDSSGVDGVRRACILEAATNFAKVADISGIVRSSQVQEVSLRSRAMSKYPDGNKAYHRLAIRRLAAAERGSESFSRSLAAYVESNLGKPYERSTIHLFPFVTNLVDLVVVV